MNRSDKNKLMLAVYLIIFWVLAFVIGNVSGLVNPWWLALIWLAFQQVYIIPKIHKLYHELKEAEENRVVRFLPWFNEMSMFGTLNSRITMVLGIIIGFFGLVAVLPMIGVDFLTPVIVSIFGESAEMQYTFYCLLFVIVFYVIINIVRGLGFIEIKRDVEETHSENFSKMGRHVISAPFEAFQYILMFFPFGRTISLMYLVDRMNKIIVLNDIADTASVEFVEEGYNVHQ